ncbi:hypothetical protein [Marinobacter sp. MBR-105]|jgi:hypothetical protein
MTKHTAVFAIFDRAQYEAYADTNCSSAHLDHTTLGAGDRIKCLARIELRTKIHAGRWQFEVVREDSTNRSSVDLSEPLINPSPILFVEQDSSHSNLARVVDFTNSGDLEGTGLNSWLIEQARQRFLQVAGPDPWLSGFLSPVDKDNSRRLPFWQRQIGIELKVDDSGTGQAAGPWLSSYNRYRSSVVALQVCEEGSVPFRECRKGGKLYWAGNLLAFKVPSDFDSISEGRSWKSVFAE